MLGIRAVEFFNAVLHGLVKGTRQRVQSFPRVDTIVLLVLGYINRIVTINQIVIVIIEELRAFPKTRYINTL